MKGLFWECGSLARWEVRHGTQIPRTAPFEVLENNQWRFSFVNRWL